MKVDRGGGCGIGVRLALVEFWGAQTRTKRADSQMGVDSLFEYLCVVRGIGLVCPASIS